MIDFSRFDAMTFDCYGTLIDWESGIMGALATLLAELDELPSEEDLLERYGSFEAEAEAAPFRVYHEVLAEVAHRFGRELGVRVTDPQAENFAESVRQWLPFSDTVQALEALSTHYRLAVLSNIDDHLFVGSAVQLGVEFETVVTAEQVRSYKPDPTHFHEAVERLDLPVDRILHVAQSLYHDIAPAKALGFTCVWVNRRVGQVGGGATPTCGATPDMEVSDLASLVQVIRPG